MHVVVASTNPVKISTTQTGFHKMFPRYSSTFEGISVPSGVSGQPMTDLETLTGALNRVQAVYLAQPTADYWVGIEGGIEELDHGMAAFAWIAIRNKAGVIGRGKTGTFFLPPQVADLIRQGKELGEADDIVFNRSNSKQQNGSVGILTHDVLTRTSFYEPAVILALIPFRNPHLF